MKRIGLLAVLLALGGVGCGLTNGFVQRREEPVKKAEQPPPPPVTADAITPQNAQDKVQALRAEMERDNRPPAPTPAGPEH
jgi:hypothetical protein